MGHPLAYDIFSFEGFVDTLDSITQIQGFTAPLYPSRQQDEYQFLQHHVQLGAGSHLQEIKCILHSIDDRDSWIFLIPRLTPNTGALCCERCPVGRIEDVYSKSFRGLHWPQKVILDSTFFPFSSERIHDLSKHRNLQEMIVDTMDLDHFGTSSMTSRTGIL